MEISVEICYYALCEDYNQPVFELLDQLAGYEGIKITTGMMSSLIEGEYKLVMEVLTKIMHPFLEKYPSVFKITIASACKRCIANE